MIKIGHFNTLNVVKTVDFGVYLDGGHFGEILLPTKVVPSNTSVGDSLKVFIYFDSEDRIIATTKRPYAELGHIAYLKVIDINRAGAFLDWGLDKDLLVPKSEQHRPMTINQSYLVYLKQDDEGRILASTKINRILDKTKPYYKTGEPVDLIIADTTDLGTKVIIQQKHWGLVYASDIFKKLKYGQHIKGYIKSMRPDGKIDVTLSPKGRDSRHDLAARILEKLKAHGGFLALHDKSPAAEIQHIFGESKKSFKNAIGHLYKQKKINITPDGIRLKK